MTGQLIFGSLRTLDYGACYIYKKKIKNCVIHMQVKQPIDQAICELTLVCPKFRAINDSISFYKYFILICYVFI